MREPHLFFVLVVVVIMGLSFAVPAEDISETLYDESEPLPYESSAVLSITLPVSVAQASTTPSRAFLLCAASLRGPGSQHPAQGTGPDYFTCNSLIILDRSLRC